MPSAPPPAAIPSEPMARMAIAVVVGGLSGGLLHGVATRAGQAPPTGWREVRGAMSAGWPEGAQPAPGSWVLRDQTAWFSRASLPGRGLRALDFEVQLPVGGLLDVWMTRRDTDRATSGDVLLRLHHAENPEARMFAWDDTGPRTVSCVPRLALSPGEPHAVGIEAAEGLLNVTIDGSPSVCAAVSGPHPPAVQSGQRGVRISGLAVDGRPVAAPSPGPLVLWALFGSLLSWAMARTEVTSGAGWTVAIIGELIVFGTALLARIVAEGVELSGFAAVAAPIAVAATLRASLHVGRALRPLGRVADWTPAAATGVLVPTLGLWVLGTLGDPPGPLGPLVIGAVLAVAGCAAALVGRPRPWRALALMGGLLTVSTLGARMFGGSTLPQIAVGTVVGLGLAAAVGGTSRTDRHGSLRFASLVFATAAVALCAEFALSRPTSVQGQPSLPPSAPVGPLPTAHHEGVFVAGGMVQTRDERGRPPARRILSVELGRPVMPIGTASWGVTEVAAAVQASGPGLQPGALVLTVATDSSRQPIVPAAGPLPALFSVVQSVQGRSARARERHLEASVRTIIDGLAPAPVLLVTGSAGLDAAPVRTAQRVFTALADADPRVEHLDFADRIEAHPDEGWVDLRGTLTERGWAEVADTLRPLLETP